MHHASGRMLPVGIAHPLKVDHMRGVMVDGSDDPEAEYEEAFVKMEGKEAPGHGKHSSSSSSKLSEQEVTDDDEGKDASSSIDSDASSSSSDSEEEGQVHSQVVAKQEKVSQDRKIAEQYSKPASIVGKSPSFPSGQLSSHPKSASLPGKCLCLIYEL